MTQTRQLQHIPLRNECNIERQGEKKFNRINTETEEVLEEEEVKYLTKVVLCLDEN